MFYADYIAPDEDMEPKLKKIKPLMTRRYTAQNVNMLIAAAKASQNIPPKNGKDSAINQINENIQESNSLISSLKIQLDCSSAALADLQKHSAQTDAALADVNSQLAQTREILSQIRRQLSTPDATQSSINLNVRKLLVENVRATDEISSLKLAYFRHHEPWLCKMLDLKDDSESPDQICKTVDQSSLAHIIENQAPEESEDYPSPLIATPNAPQQQSTKSNLTSPVPDLQVTISASEAIEKEVAVPPSNLCSDSEDDTALGSNDSKTSSCSDLSSFEETSVENLALGSTANYPGYLSPLSSSTEEFLTLMDKGEAFFMNMMDKYPPPSAIREYSNMMDDPLLVPLNIKSLDKSTEKVSTAHQDQATSPSNLKTNLDFGSHQQFRNFNSQPSKSRLDSLSPIADCEVSSDQSSSEAYLPSSFASASSPKSFSHQSPLLLTSQKTSPSLETLTKWRSCPVLNCQQPSSTSDIHKKSVGSDHQETKKSQQYHQSITSNLQQPSNHQSSSANPSPRDSSQNQATSESSKSSLPPDSKINHQVICMKNQPSTFNYLPKEKSQRSSHDECPQKLQPICFGPSYRPNAGQTGQSSLPKLKPREIEASISATESTTTAAIATANTEASPGRKKSQKPDSNQMEGPPTLPEALELRKLNEAHSRLSTKRSALKMDAKAPNALNASSKIKNLKSQGIDQALKYTCSKSKFPNVPTIAKPPSSHNVQNRLKNSQFWRF